MSITTKWLHKYWLKRFIEQALFSIKKPNLMFAAIIPFTNFSFCNSLRNF